MNPIRTGTASRAICALDNNGCGFFVAFALASVTARVTEERWLKTQTGSSAVSRSATRKNA